MREFWLFDQLGSCVYNKNHSLLLDYWYSSLEIPSIDIESSKSKFLIKYYICILSETRIMSTVYCPIFVETWD